MAAATLAKAAEIFRYIFMLVGCYDCCVSCYYCCCRCCCCCMPLFTPKPQHFCATTSQLHSTKVVMCCTLFSFYLLQLLCVNAAPSLPAPQLCPLSVALLHVCAFACFHFIKIATFACCWLATLFACSYAGNFCLYFRCCCCFAILLFFLVFALQLLLRFLARKCRQSIPGIRHRWCWRLTTIISLQVQQLG